MEQADAVLRIVDAQHRTGEGGGGCGPQRSGREVLGGQLEWRGVLRGGRRRAQGEESIEPGQQLFVFVLSALLFEVEQDFSLGLGQLLREGIDLAADETEPFLNRIRLIVG